MPRIMTICTLDAFVKSARHSMPAQTAVAHWETYETNKYPTVDIFDYFRQNIKQLTDNEIFYYANQFIKANPTDATFLDDLTILLKEIKPDYVPYVLRELGRYNPKLNDECVRLAA